jgi:hypothetical protein
MRAPLSFWLKVFLAAGLVALADVGLFQASFPGAGLALLLAALVAAVALSSPARWRNKLGAAALAIATLFALVQIDRPSILAVAFVLIGVGVAVLSPRVRSGDDAWRWALRLLASILGVIGPVLDALKVSRLLKARSRIRISGVVGAAILPVVGGAVFLGLFLAANPLLSELFGDLALPPLDPGRLIFWIAIALAAWTALRPRTLRFRARKVPVRPHKPLIGVGSVTASLVVFNLIFALQNGLDIAFLWSGAALPHEMTHAEYAHRGAYPLIATALLAGLFVLVFLKPGSPTAASPRIRQLVTLWIAQNVFLVASTMLRTAAYIEAYSLTRLRIAALLWMALVALGLILIVWRLLRARSASWLINANVLAAGVVLAGCAVVDLGAIAATWNVRHAIKADIEMDADYIAGLNGAGLIALATLEPAVMSPEGCVKVRRLRQQVREEIVARQADWRSWRWRDARRLETDARVGGHCTVRPISAPLTPTAKP